MNSGLYRLADLLVSVLSSPNEMDTNGETANMVDGLFAIARGLNRVAQAIERGTQIVPPKASGTN